MSRLLKKSIGKGISKIYHWETLTFSKLVAIVNFSERNLKKCPSFEEQERIRYIQENVYFGIIVFSCLSSTKPCLGFLSNRFAQEIKGFCRNSLGNGVDFRDIMNVSSNILAKIWNFTKMRHCFVDERALITTTLISSCERKPLYLFCLRKKRSENAFLTLIVNYHKIAQKSKLYHWKQQ